MPTTREKLAIWLGRCPIAYQVSHPIFLHHIIFTNVQSPNRWLYALILTIDANFRLKLKDKGYAEDPALGDGWAHWVESEPYKDYTRRYGHQVEVCTSPCLELLCLKAYYFTACLLRL